MTKSAFDEIAAGLNDAIAHARGDERRAQAQEVSPIDVQALRNELGMTQCDFATAFGVSLSTVQNWEQRRRAPRGAARVLLQVIAREPDAVRRVLLESA